MRQPSCARRRLAGPGDPVCRRKEGTWILGRFLILLVLVVVLGGAIFLLTWDIPPPTAGVEVVIPDDRLPR